MVEHVLHNSKPYKTRPKRYPKKAMLRNW